ncbi:MAG: ribonuclease HII [Bacteroidales bacterium]|nr:ribonuclease HII [Bacteroidales bacterium]MCR5549443.1 ribonuclease HII [Bacteroidales bacterium]
MVLKSHYSDKPCVECGCDEAGRGCLAGPVCAAAVVFPYDYVNEEINDSKQLTAAQREKLRAVIERDALAFCVAEVSEKRIDEINILNASIQGMNDAVAGLSVKPELLLIDGNRFKDRLGIPYKCVVKGDATYLSIAAASILAKTYRDALMIRLDAEYPAYDWRHNMGYPTPKHIAAVMEHGFTPYHRRSFHLKNQLSLEF